MNALRATIAIIRREMRPHWLYSIGARLVLGVALGVWDTFHFGWALSIMMILAVPLGMAAGLEPRVRDLTYFISPLYGRQIARAFAMTAATSAVAFPCAFALATIVTAIALAGSADYLNSGVFVRSNGWPGLSFSPTNMEWLIVAAALIAAIGSIVAALVSLSGTARKGAARFIYIVLACIAGYVVSLLSMLAVFGEIPYVAGAIAFNFLVGFLALRAFGETLARYDPIPTN